MDDVIGAVPVPEPRLSMSGIIENFQARTIKARSKHHAQIKAILEEIRTTKLERLRRQIRS